MSGTSATFQYDGFGRRAAKTINGQSRNFLYDTRDIVRESGPGGQASYLRSLAIDEVLSRTGTTGTAHYLADALGSTLALADAAGNLPTTYTFAPFGQSSVSGLPSSNPFQFTGRENDSTGLYYYRARHYDPVRSRFVSPEPLGIRSSETNLYAYAGNSPANVTDPLGLFGVVSCSRCLYYMYECLAEGLKCKEREVRRCREEEDRIATPPELVKKCWFENPSCEKKFKYCSLCATVPSIRGMWQVLRDVLGL